MCGIIVFYNIGNKDILKYSLRAIIHRGPDDQGIEWFHKHNTGLGHVRLSIIDLSRSGHQPMADDKNKLWITYNGEIYNFKAIKKELSDLGYTFKSNSDTEVLLKGYQEWGVKILDKVNGMYAFCIFDSDSGELFCARDRSGIKPLYYYQSDDKIIVTSEIKAIIRSGLFSIEPDYFSLYSPARFQITPYTGFKDIYKLPAGHYMKFKNGNLSIKKYWEIKANEQLNNFIFAENRLNELLNDSVKLQLIADVKLGVFLSGGLDSSIIAALMRQYTDREIHSFTIKFSNRDQNFEKMPDDAYYAKIIAQKFNFKHHELEIKPNIVDLLPKLIYHLDEPLSDPATINTYLISNEAQKNNIKVLLNGMGGDEIFGGYRKHLACLHAELFQKYIPQLVNKSIPKLIKFIPVASQSSGFRYIRWLKRFLSFANLEQYSRFLASDASMSEEQFNKIYCNKMEYKNSYFYHSQQKYFSNNNLSYLGKMCLLDSSVFLTEHNLLYSDKASMAASIESRPPLTDHRIIEFMSSLEPQFRINKLTQKYLLKKVAEKYLPRKIVYRPKAPFGSPLRSWVRNDLKEMIDDYLSHDSIKKRGFFNAKAVRQIILNDRKGYEDNSLIIWHFLTNEIWFRTFFKGDL